MTPLTTVPDAFTTFATEDRPLRPSSAAKFLGCPMSVLLSLGMESASNTAAQTGNLVHSAVHAYHTEKGDRVAAGDKALAEARSQFPEGDPEKAARIFRSYVADPANSAAEVVWCEEKVRLTLPSPDGVPVVIAGTLDQVRRKDGKLRVWDVKTGTRLNAAELLAEHTIQQAIYVLAARQTLDPSVEPGGLIYTDAYAQGGRAKVILPLRITVPQCMLLVSSIVERVGLVRRGVVEFHPSADTCRFCPHKPWPACVELSKGLNYVQGV